MFFTTLRRHLFAAIHRRNLIYNTCWEDPALDRAALDLGPADRVLVITSAGCNALDYLLAGAGRVEAVDLNPCQNALLEFKAAAIRGLDYDSFFELFGTGRSKRARQMYHDAVRPCLSPRVRRWWDRHLGFFSGKGWRDSFYYHGTWGFLAWVLVGYWKHCRGVAGVLEEMFRASSLEEQRHLYETRLRDRVWTPWVDRFNAGEFTQMLMGIPWRQRQFMMRYPGGLARWTRQILEALATEIPLRTNYFMRVYVQGSYTPECCPEYLKADNFERLKRGLLDRLTIHTTSVTEYLRRAEPGISRFVLLDHMDWMEEAELAEEWEILLAKASPGGRAIFRSALLEVDYLDPVPVRFRDREARLGQLLHYDREPAARLHRLDRVHMYGSFHIATLPGAAEGNGS
jgi:S-adenosylmethionine-diacylglycerol 3-amino-3-carboxypropyl transferase